MGKHFVEFCTYSLRMEDFRYTHKVVSERDPQKIWDSDTVFYKELLLGYRFFDRTDTVENGKEIIGKRENVSGWTYYEGPLIICKKWYGCNPKIEENDQVI